MKNIIKLIVFAAALFLGFYLIFGPGFDGFEIRNGKDTGEQEKLDHIVDNGAGIHAMDMIEILSDPEFMGRKTGSEGFEMAAKFVEGIYKELELEPVIQANDQPGYRQIYEQPYNQLRKPFEFSLSHQTGSELTPSFGEKFTFDPSSDRGDMKEEMVFVGHGIKEKDYDDFQGVCLDGKIAVALFRIPGEFSPQAYIDRAEQIADKGAKALVYIVEDDDEEIKTSVFARWWGSREPAPFPVVWIDESTGDELLKPATFNVSEWKEDFQVRNRPRSFPLDYDARIKVENTRKDAQGMNLVAKKEFSPNSPYLLLTAHLDTPGITLKGENLPGANDNASGVGVLLETISRIQRENKEYPFNIILAIFGGEEDGLRGSKHFVDNMPVDPAEIAQVINIDMVGAGEDKLVARAPKGGIEQLERPLENLAKRSENFEYQQKGLTPRSDHWSFAVKGYPTIYLYRPLHENPSKELNLEQDEFYHTPEDKPETLVESYLDNTVNLLLELFDEIDVIDKKESAGSYLISYHHFVCL